jgi:hypothetical protein
METTMNGITYFVAVFIVFLCALPFGLLAALVQYPWLVFVILWAIVIAILTKRSPL